MKSQLQSIRKTVWKGSLILICYFFMAACMQHDESLAPNKLQNDLLLSHGENEGQGSLMKKTFVAHLKGENEIPAIDTQAQGQVIFKLSDDGNTISYKLIVANIENVIAAHIHCGDATVARGAILVDLLPGVTLPTGRFSGVLAEGEFTSANLVTRADASNCPGGVSSFEDLIERIQNGTSYVNVHTRATPSGAIRGQIH